MLKSTYHGMAEVCLSTITIKELTVVGSRCGPFEPALRLLASGSVEVLSLIDAEFRLADAIAALDHAGQPGIRKVLLRP